MAIDLIVEDGTMPPGANTYASLDDFRAWMAQRWPDYDPATADDDNESASLVQAFDVENSYNYKGFTAEPGRIVAWPRKGMTYADGTPVAENAIPAQVPFAQFEIAADILRNEAQPLAPVDRSKGPVTSEKVDVIAVSYASPAENEYSGVTGYPAVDSLLKPFLKGGSGRFGVVEVGRG